MAARALSYLFALFIILPSPVSGSAFLAADGNRLKESSDLLSELETVAGEDHRAAVQRRVSYLEEVLRPSFRALPQDGEGRIPADAVRYLLHRVFVDRHGWSVRGLDARGESWGESSAAEVFREHSAEVHGIFAERLEAQGFTLHEAAVLAATLESFVHSEAVERLQSAYRLVGQSPAGSGEADALEVIDTYMLMFVLGMNHTTATEQEIVARGEVIGEVHPLWKETQAWVRQVRSEVLSAKGAHAGSEEAVSFDTTTTVVEEVAERYGRWQDQECRELKSSLVGLEQNSSGRVRLETFYRSALQGNWQFSESKEYLRELGALDESDPLRPSVIIPNYVHSPSNCVASSKFFSVCCIDECEGILGHLEEQIAAPSASPERIAELVAKLASSTVEAPRSLPRELVGRLQSIAEQHGGKVPLHGRLFAQWLHHAYPRECPFPHRSGGAKPMTAVQWAAQGRAVEASPEDMQLHIEGVELASVASGIAPQVAIPWSAEEELFVRQPELPPAGVGICRVGVLLSLAGLASMVVSLGGAISPAVGALGGKQPLEKRLKEHLV